MPKTETVIAGALTALTGLNGAWLSTSARYLLSNEAFMVLAAGTLVTGAMAARHMRRMLRTTDATAGRTSFTAAVFVILIAVGAWIGRAQAIEVLNQFGD